MMIMWPCMWSCDHTENQMMTSLTMWRCCCCSFDDSSSISSGDISDAINEISTDENQTGSSRSGTSSDRTNPYASLKRAPGTSGAPTAPAQSTFATRSLPARTNTAFVARNGILGRHLTSGVRDSVDSLIRAGPVRGEQLANGADAYGYKRKPTTGGSTCIAVEDPYITNLSDPSQGQHQMALTKGGSSFGYRRSNGAPSSGSGKSSSCGTEASKGERLSNYNGGVTGATRPNALGSKLASGTQTVLGYTRDAPDKGTESTLERKKKANLVSSKTQTVLTGLPGQGEDGPKGRRSDNGPHMCSSTHGSLNRDGSFGASVSTPGAFSRMDVMRHSFNHPSSSSDASPGHLGSSFLSPDFVPSRPLSALSSPTSGAPWLKSGMLHTNGLRSTMSESESMESVYSMSSSIQAQIQQAKALAQASRNILQRDGQTPGLQRSDSFRSSKSEQVTPATRPMSLGRTGSFTQLTPGGAGKTSPTPSQSSQSSSSHYAYPYSMGLSLGPAGSSASNSPYSTVYLPLSKRSASKEDDRKLFSIFRFLCIVDCFQWVVS